MISFYVVLDDNGNLSYEWFGNFFNLDSVKYLSSDYKFFYKVDNGHCVYFKYLDGTVVDFDIFNC